jgi:uncharacterized caspase-like protein
MRIALLIGVSEYENLDPLHAVANDIAAMERLLLATKLYTEVLTLHGSLPSEETKNRISDFLDSYREERLEEVFVYYSGHGGLIDRMLCFPMSDYREDEPRQSSIKNDELDRWIKALRPSLAVKVLDCCYAGVPYIKGIGDIKEALDEARAAFSDCYFFFSSRHDQASRTGGGVEALSVFTEHFIRAVAARKDGPVRYQQLVDALADSLDGQGQEPQFITQGSAKHVFCHMTSELRAAIYAKEEERTAEESIDPRSAPANLLEAVEADAENCIPEDEALKTLREIRVALEVLSLNSELGDFYDLRVRFVAEPDLDSEVYGEEILGNWLKSRGKAFFARATETKPALPYSPASVNWWRSREPIVTGFAASSGLEYDRLTASALPKHPNLRRWELAVVFLWSPRELAIFTSTVSPKRIRWDQYEEPEEVGWRRRHFQRRQLHQAPAHVEAVMKRFWRGVSEYLESSFGNPGKRTG